MKPTMSGSFAGNQVAVVTGSSTGIGAAIALELANAGWDLILHGRSESDELLSVKARVESCGRQVHLQCCDFSNTNNLEEFVAGCWNAFGLVSTLVNNAGGDVLTGPRAGGSFVEKLDYLVKVDVLATLLLSREFGARMMEKATQSDCQNGSFSIINIGWDQAYQGMSGDSGEMFATTKGAIMSMSKSLAQSLAPKVRVNCVAPGWIQTQWGKNTTESWHQKAVGDSLMQRWGQPDDVAALVSYLASDRASFVSGQVIPVNGGFNFGRP